MKNHAFFSDIDWNQIATCTHQAHFVPRVKGNEDTSCIDKLFTREGLACFIKKMQIFFLLYPADYFNCFRGFMSTKSFCHAPCFLQAQGACSWVGSRVAYHSAGGPIRRMTIQ